MTTPKPVDGMAQDEFVAWLKGNIEGVATEYRERLREALGDAATAVTLSPFKIEHIARHRALLDYDRSLDVTWLGHLEYADAAAVMRRTAEIANEMAEVARHEAEVADATLRAALRTQSPKATRNEQSS